MEFVRVVYEKEARAIVFELVVPNIGAINDLSHIEFLICNTNNVAEFSVLLNRSDRVAPIPPGAFGVIIHPNSKDRSIKNVSSAGYDGQWDQDSTNGTLLKQSASGVAGGNLGIGIWITPLNWNQDSYFIKTRTTKKDQQPTPWQKLATFDYSGKGVSRII